MPAPASISKGVSVAVGNGVEVADGVTVAVGVFVAVGLGVSVGAGVGLVTLTVQPVTNCDTSAIPLPSITIGVADGRAVGITAVTSPLE
jgi:hypothetical protein